MQQQKEWAGIEIGCGKGWLFPAFPLGSVESPLRGLRNSSAILATLFFSFTLTLTLKFV